MGKGYTYKFDAWGPDFWRVAHSVTFLYPVSNPSENDKRVVTNFFTLLPFLLPCAACGMHFQATMKDMPLDGKVLASQDSLSRWLVKVHNTVNARKGKPLAKYEDVYQFYEKNDKHVITRRDARGRFDRDSEIIGAILIALIVGTALAVYLRR